MVHTGDSMDDFESVWNEMITALKPGTEIRHWNPYNGYLGECLTIVTSSPESIAVDPPRVWDYQLISKNDFEKVWNVWGEYKDLHLERRTIRDLTDHHKYIISILH